MFELYFLTSSRVKYDHLRFLFRNYSIDLKPQIDYGKPYSEPRIYDRSKLLLESIEDANVRMGRNAIPKEFSSSNDFSSREERKKFALSYQDKVFIIEDTSVIIEALSSEIETPGLDVKYWMKHITFDQLDQLLKSHGNNRRVVVRSDIALYLPRLLRLDDKDRFYRIFTGMSEGTIVEREEHFDTNPVYPWLDNKTFNKWFQPEGETRPISVLPIDIATTYDFRAKAVEDLLCFLQNLGLEIGNKRPRPITDFQADLFRKKSWVVCGPTCTGKSVLAAYLAKKFGFYHIEASDFMYLAYYRKHGFDFTTSIHDFALMALKEDPMIVAREVLAHIEEVGDRHIVITGFRSPSELTEFVFNQARYSVIYIESSAIVRYQRCLNRGRMDSLKSFDNFLELDKLQRKMGLAKIRKLPDVMILRNNCGLRDYLRRFEERYLKDVQQSRINRIQMTLSSRYATLPLEPSILIALWIERRDIKSFYTTTEIAGIINKNIPQWRQYKGERLKTDKNNVSRYFNQRRYPYYEVRRENGTIRYRLSITGVSYAKHVATKYLLFHGK